MSSYISTLHFSSSYKRKQSITQYPLPSSCSDRHSIDSLNEPLLGENENENDDDDNNAVNSPVELNHDQYRLIEQILRIV